MWDKHQGAQTSSGTNIKWHKHQVGHTSSWTNNKWDKHRVVPISSGEKHQVGQTIHVILSMHPEPGRVLYAVDN